MMSQVRRGKSLNRFRHMTGLTLYKTADRLRLAHATPVAE